MDKDPAEINYYLESICQCGCEVVSATIEALEQGHAPPQAARLDSEGQAKLLRELKSIMAVYESHPGNLIDD